MRKGLDQMVHEDYLIETYGTTCLDCAAGEPHCCPVVDREYRTAIRRRDAAQAVIDEIESHTEPALSTA